MNSIVQKPRKIKPQKRSVSLLLVVILALLGWDAPEPLPNPPQPSPLPPAPLPRPGLYEMALSHSLAHGYNSVRWEVFA